MKFTINTTPMAHGVIAQEVISDFGLKDMKDVLFRQVIKTQDAEIEKALIAMGWTPPGKTAEIVAKAGEVMRERCAVECARRQMAYATAGYERQAQATAGLSDDIRSLPDVTLEDLK